MTDQSNGSISEDELSKLLGDSGDEMFDDSMFSDKPVLKMKNTPPAGGEKKTEKILSQAEIDALIANMGK